VKAWISTALAGLGTTVDVLPYPVRLVLGCYLAACVCVVLGLAVLRDIRKFRRGE
jgi:hypothetical protein